jgi:hypothetical protein
MEGLAQGAAEMTLCFRGQLSEIEGSRVRAPGDVRQHQQAMDPFVIDTAATISARDFGGHLRQPGEQKRRDPVELLVEDRRPPELDQIPTAPSIPRPGNASSIAPVGTRRHDRTLPPARPTGHSPISRCLRINDSGH